jgi:hypothetical protein
LSSRMIGDREKLVIGPEQGGVVAIAHIKVIRSKVYFVLLTALVIDKPGREGVMEPWYRPRSRRSPAPWPRRRGRQGILASKHSITRPWSTPKLIGGNSSAFLGRGTFGGMVFMPLFPFRLSDGNSRRRVTEDPAILRLV